MVLRFSYALLFTWTALACLAAMTKVSLPLHCEVYEEDGVALSRGAAVQDYCVAVSVSTLVSSVKVTQEQMHCTAQVRVEADEL